MIISKKKLIVMVALFVVLTSLYGLVDVWENPQLDMRTNEIKVLFDFTKSEDAGNADWRIDGAYSDFADALRNDGFIVESLGTGSGTITSTDLSGYDVFVLPEPQNEFTTDEKNAIINFVSNGGGLIYIADHKSSDRDNDGWDSWNIWNDNLDFDTTFGITLESTQSGNGDHEVTDIEHVDILTDNVTSFGVWLGTTMSVSSGAYAAAYQTIGGNRLPVLAYTYYGNGRVVVHCDSSTFDDGTPDSDNSGDDLTNNWNDYDDATLAVNLVKWAAKVSGGGGSGETPVELSKHTGKQPSVAYGDGKYLLAFYNGKYVNATFIDSSDGSQGGEFNLYRYGQGIRTVYNPDGNNFTVVSYDYFLPNYHKVIMKFVESDGTLGDFYTVSTDANQSMDAAYGSGKILIVWANLSRESIKGAFYNTQTGTMGTEFTIYSSGEQKYDVAVGYDPSSNKFLVVWSSNYDLHGIFVNSDGSIGSSVNFPSTPNVQESMMAVAGGDHTFLVTYRNGSFSSASGLYFYLVSPEGSFNQKTVNENSAKYCGRADVRWIGDRYMITYSDCRNGNQDVFVLFFDSSGNQIGDEIVVEDSSDSEETPTGDAGNSTMLVAWYDHDQKSIGAKYYPPSTIPEMNPGIVALLCLTLILIRRRKRFPS